MTKHGRRSQAKSAPSCSAVSLGGAPADILLLGFLAVASITDLRERRIPNMLVGAMAACWVILVLGEAAALGLGDDGGEGAWMPFMCHAGPGLLSAALLGGFLFALTCAFEHMTHRYALGGGDIKLVSCIALYLGFDDACLALLVACLLAMLSGGLLRMLERAPLWGQGAFFDLSVPEPSCFASDDRAVLVSGGAGERMPRATALALPFAPALAVGTLCTCILGA